MSKQVELKGDNLFVHTREDYKQASRVIFMRKGETSKVLYPVIPPFINDLEVVKDWTICGYRVEDLYKLALILRDRRIDDVNLSDYNESYLAGYERAREEINKQLEESVNRIIKGVGNN